MTIAAIATPQGSSGIGMVRLSGTNALAIAQKIATPKHQPGGLSALKGYTAALCSLTDREGAFDEGVVFVYRAPKSYTGEDMVEICCHGGSVLTTRTLTALLDAGATPAGAGEFTKRAFLNGKLSLLEAEAVNNLINADSAAAAAAAFAAKEGSVARALSKIREQLLSAAAALSVWADYPDDNEDMLPEAIERVEDAKARLTTLLDRYDQGSLLQKGIPTAIIGRPNVGKSTLMNLLCGQETSIVTDIPGTTRDVIRSTVQLGKLLLNLSDTAGIRETADTIEAMGVQRSYDAATGAALILLLLEAGEPVSPEEYSLLESYRSRPLLVLQNKTDCAAPLDDPAFSGIPVVAISAKTGDGVEQLEQEISALLELQKISPHQPLLQTQRQRQCAQMARAALEELLKAHYSGITPDAVSVLLDDALSALLELTGERVSETVVDKVFSEFCVGK